LPNLLCNNLGTLPCGSAELFGDGDSGKVEEGDGDDGQDDGDDQLIVVPNLQKML
jgi:hypothetical protein